MLHTKQFERAYHNVHQWPEWVCATDSALGLMKGVAHSHAAHAQQGHAAWRSQAKQLQQPEISRLLETMCMPVMGVLVELLVAGCMHVLVVESRCAHAATVSAVRGGCTR
jgi:hypothetical protein